MVSTPKPVLLCILDGWGCREEHDHNAIKAAKTPNFDFLWNNFPHGMANASEAFVGLPEGQMGNSEVGHMNIGSGRVVMQELPRINKAVESGALAENQALKDFTAKLKTSGGACHLMGLVSPGGVHAHQSHIAALAKLIAARGIKVYIHAFLDGRDTPPQSAQPYLKQLETSIAGSPNTCIATVSGRYYAMDRDQRWDRVKLAFDAMTAAYGKHAKTAKAAVEASYANKYTDEFMLPAVIDGYKGMRSGDGILMANFRSDRARQLLTALLEPSFTGFQRGRQITFPAALGMVEYSESLAKYMRPLFPPEQLTNLLGEVASNAGRKQLRIAETEKYAHVTFFFNGGREEVFPGEDRILVPSPQVATYDLQPEMSAPELTDKLVAAIDSGTYDLIVANYANTDMVGHTGNLEAARKAVECVDTCLGRVWAALEKSGGALVLSADHGNAEMMHDSDEHQPHTAHTLNLVPVIVASKTLQGRAEILQEGKLADLAPTVLALMGLKQPAEMTGSSLIVPR